MPAGFSIVTTSSLWSNISIPANTVTIQKIFSQWRHSSTQRDLRQPRPEHPQHGGSGRFSNDHQRGHCFPVDVNAEDKLHKFPFYKETQSMKSIYIVLNSLSNFPLLHAAVCEVGKGWYLVVQVLNILLNTSTWRSGWLNWQVFSKNDKITVSKYVVLDICIMWNWWELD